MNELGQNLSKTESLRHPALDRNSPRTFSRRQALAKLGSGGVLIGVFGWRLWMMLNEDHLQAHPHVLIPGTEKGELTFDSNGAPVFSINRFDVAGKTYQKYHETGGREVWGNAESSIWYDKSESSSPGNGRVWYQAFTGGVLTFSMDINGVVSAEPKNVVEDIVNSDDSEQKSLFYQHYRINQQTLKRGPEIFLIRPNLPSAIKTVYNSDPDRESRFGDVLFTCQDQSGNNVAVFQRAVIRDDKGAVKIDYAGQIARDKSYGIIPEDSLYPVMSDPEILDK